MRMEMEVVWTGASWRDVPRDVAPPVVPMPLERELEPLLRRIRTLMADGQKRRPAQVRTEACCDWNAAQRALAQLEAEGVLRGWRVGRHQWYQRRDA